eukprot:GHVU01146634.1.p1 GENE.GHVU01146634.1~~GHVU01146634.1.p1  ORF type:complete len:113 (+),score=4.83 GHVU01146634.1:809-1147(+)
MHRPQEASSVVPSYSCIPMHHIESATIPNLMRSTAPDHRIYVHGDKDSWVRTDLGVDVTFADVGVWDLSEQAPAEDQLYDWESLLSDASAPEAPDEAEAPDGVLILSPNGKE